MKNQQATATPKPEIEHQLLYRGKQQFTGTKSECNGEKIRLLGTNCFLKLYFEIKAVEENKQP